MIIASESSNRQTRSLARSVYDAAREQKVDVLSVEGEDTGEWVVLDLADIVIHCMQPAH